MGDMSNREGERKRTVARSREKRGERDGSRVLLCCIVEKRTWENHDSKGVVSKPCRIFLSTVWCATSFCVYIYVCAWC